MQQEFSLLRGRKCSVPVGVRLISRQQGAFQKPLHFIFEAYLVVRYRPVSQKTQQPAADGRRYALRASRIAVCRISDVAAKQFIRALAAQGDRNVFAAERREKPDRKSARIGERLVGVVGHLLDRRGQIQGGGDIQLVVLGGLLS